MWKDDTVFNFLSNIDLILSEDCESSCDRQDVYSGNRVGLPAAGLTLAFNLFPIKFPAQCTVVVWSSPIWISRWVQGFSHCKAIHLVVTATKDARWRNYCHIAHRYLSFFNTLFSEIWFKRWDWATFRI